jgi:hypothetical protein
MNNGKFTISMQGWLDSPTITRSNDGKWEAVTGYDVGPGLHYKPADGDITQTTSISFSLPETGVTKLANGQAPDGDYYFYLWNGVDFDLGGVDGSPNFTQILQPVIWKGRGAIAIPVNNESNTAGVYPGYTWIYDHETGQTAKSDAWTSKNLDTYTLENYQSDVNLHYFEDGEWRQLNSKNNWIQFQETLSQYEIYFNSQYITAFDNVFTDGKNSKAAMLSMLSKDIIAVPSSGASINLNIQIPSDGSSISITGTPVIEGFDSPNPPQSILNVDEIYHPLTNKWTQDNVFNTTPLTEIGNIWNFVDCIYPVLGETYAIGLTEDAARQSTERMADLLNGLTFDIELQKEPSFQLQNESLNNPVTPLSSAPSVEPRQDGQAGDTLLGTTQSDQLRGGGGDDLIDGGDGDDQSQGNQGSDTFILSQGEDIIHDFSLEQNDQLGVRSDQSFLSFNQIGDNLLIKDTSGSSTTLLNINMEQFLKSDSICML